MNDVIPGVDIPIVEGISVFANIVPPSLITGHLWN